jgi:DNA-binding CsgD family transcriptional regulator
MIGRQHETRVLGEILDGVSRRGAGVLVRGEPGIGKTVLVCAIEEAARERGFEVWRTVAVESETSLPFAGLHVLLRPVMNRIADLPGPQRDALLAAFGMAEVSTPDPFLIGLACFHLVSEAASRRPLLLLVDDAQWFDGPSAQVLAFVARRVESDAVVLLAAMRDGFESPLASSGMTELHLEGLSQVEAAELLDARAPGLDPTMRERILADADGNPLALVELPLAVRSAIPGVARALPSVLPLTARLECAFAKRAVELPEATRTLLLIAAIDDHDGLSEILAAARELVGTPVGADAFGPAVDAGLVRVDDATIRFRHPLVRSALHQQAGGPARRGAHAAIATVVSDDPDRRASHRAGATVGQDEAVARELEAAAARARRRGGIQVALSAQERAARLTPDPRDRCCRLLVAAEMAYELGSRDLVLQLLGDVERLGPSPLERRRVAWIRERFDDGVPGHPTHVRALVESADQARDDGDDVLSLSLLLGAAVRCWWADPGADARQRVVDAAERVQVDECHPLLLAVLAIAAPIERASVVMHRLGRMETASLHDPDRGRLLGMAAYAVGHFEMSDALLRSSADGLRSQGRFALLAHSLGNLAHSAIELGDFETTMMAAGECRRIAEQTAQPIWVAAGLAGEAAIAALRGEPETAESLVTAAESIVLPRRLSDGVAVLLAIRGMSAVSMGRHDEAYHHLRRMFDPSDIAYHRRELFRGITYFAEAAAHSGHRREGLDVIRSLESMVAESPSPKLHVSMAYARAVLAEDREAGTLYEAAFDSRLQRWPVDRARLQLAYGGWLRRRRRAKESRAPLREARDTFAAHGLTPWRERAESELRASGQPGGHRGPERWTELSPQELQIARMAAQRLTNAEIGQRLYLSPRTVGSHLYRIFPKIGITSRSQLRDALGVNPTASTA